MSQVARLTTVAGAIKLSLAQGAVEGGAPGLDKARNRAGAPRAGAGRAFTIIDAEPMLEISKLAIGLAVIAQR